LINQIKKSVEYWIVAGPSCSGKTTVAKYLAAEYGFKLIEYENYLAAIK
jgi:adenylate kinase family enzyme